MAERDCSPCGLYGAVTVSRPAKAADLPKVTPFVGALSSKPWLSGANETGDGDFSHSVTETSACSGILFAGSDLSMPLSGTRARQTSLTGFFRLGHEVFADAGSAHSVTATSAPFGPLIRSAALWGRCKAGSDRV
jgi:hypothetical protein